MKTRTDVVPQLISSTLSKQDEDTTELNEAEVVEGRALIAHHEPTEIAEPGEKSLDFPAAFVATKWSAILGLGLLSVAAVRSDHLDTKLGERCIEGVGVVGAVADEPLGQLRYDAGVEGGGNERHLVRRSRGGTSGERKTKAVCHCHELRPFAPLGFSHTPAPFFATMNVP